MYILESIRLLRGPTRPAEEEHFDNEIVNKRSLGKA